MSFHEMFCSSNLSGLIIGLKNGALYTDNMSLNNQRLLFDEVTSQDQKSTQVDTTGISHSRVFNNGSDKRFLNLNQFGLSQSTHYSMGNMSHVDSMSLLPGGSLFVEQFEEGVRKNTLTLEPSLLNVSTTRFTLSNSGDLWLQSSQNVSIQSNASLQLHANSVRIVSDTGLQLCGDMINTTSGGYVNKFLKVQICNASGVYEHYQIPLMNPS
jgi:hypothetical protein